VNVSVVICANDSARWSQLRAALRSIELQDHPPAEVIVVIDHNPALLERARRGLHGALVVENSEPPGLGGARNSGIAVSAGEVVAFLDDDATASPDWLSRLVAHYSDPDVAGVGGGVQPVWTTTRPRWFPREFDWVVGCTYRGMPETAQEVRNPVGCNMSFRRDLLNAVGRFRAGLTLRGPDAQRRRGDLAVHTAPAALALEEAGLRPGRHRVPSGLSRASATAVFPHALLPRGRIEGRHLQAREPRRRAFLRAPVHT
jgi:glycosyltransferase involved in cell wall biosynthesis